MMTTNKNPETEKSSGQRNHTTADNNLPLSHRDATAASPDDESVCGEEDPGVALESMVDQDK